MKELTIVYDENKAKEYLDAIKYTQTLTQYNEQLLEKFIYAIIKTQKAKVYCCIDPLLSSCAGDDCVNCLKLFKDELDEIKEMVI